MKILPLLSLLFLTTNFSGKPGAEKTNTTVSSPVKAATFVREENNEIIPWITERRLEWTDFLCAPQKQGEAVASTSTTLGISYQLKNGNLSYTITCVFSKRKSWGLLKTDYILAHEQAHFDITELHARKLHQALLAYQYKPGSYKKDISRIYERIVKEKEDMQEVYDNETDHSRKKKIQYDWLEKIDSMLKETEPLAAYP